MTDPILYNNPLTQPDYEIPEEQHLNINPDNYAASTPRMNSNIFNPDYSLKEPTFEDKIALMFTKNSAPITAPAYEIPIHVAKRYNDPLLGYNPTADNEEIYSQAHPFTWGKSWDKMVATYKAHVGNSFKTIAGGLSGIAKGDLNAVWDNPYSEELANVTKAIEESYAHYESKDQKDNPFAKRNFFNNTLKKIFPATGTAFAAITDMIITEAAFTIGGTLLNPGGGTIAGGMAGATKGALNLPKWYQAIRSTAKGYTTGTHSLRAFAGSFGTKSILDSSKFMFTSFLAANGEAALEAKMGGHEFYTKQVQAFYKKHGYYPTGKELENIENAVHDMEQTVYRLNLAILGTSNAIQFGSILRGKGVLNKFASNTINKEGLKATTKGALKRSVLGLEQGTVSVLGKEVFKHPFKPTGFLWDVGSSAFSEGMEEFLQGVSKSSTEKYFDTMNNDENRSLTNEFFKSALHNIGTNEGLLEFVGGALIGGGMSAGPSALANTQKYLNAKKLAEGFNTSTAVLLNGMKHFQNDSQGLITNIKDGNVGEAERNMVDLIFNKVYSDLKRGTIESGLDTIDDLTIMEAEEFSKFIGLPTTKEDQASIVKYMKDQYMTNRDILVGVENWGKINPLTDTGPVRRLWKQLPGLGKLFNNEKEYQAQMWEMIKKEYAYNLSNADFHMKKNEEMESFLSSSLAENGVDAYIIDSLINLPTNREPSKWFAESTKVFKQMKNAEVAAGVTTNTNLLKSILSSDKGSMEKYQAILDYYQVNKATKVLLDEYLRNNMALYIFEKNSEDLNTLSGMKERAESISDYLEYIAQEELNIVSMSENIDSTSNPNPLESSESNSSAAVSKDEISNTNEVTRFTALLSRVDDIEKLEDIIQQAKSKGIILDPADIANTRDRIALENRNNKEVNEESNNIGKSMRTQIQEAEDLQTLDKIVKENPALQNVYEQQIAEKRKELTPKVEENIAKEVLAETKEKSNPSDKELENAMEEGINANEDDLFKMFVETNDKKCE